MSKDLPPFLSQSFFFLSRDTSQFMKSLAAQFWLWNKCRRLQFFLIPFCQTFPYRSTLKEKKIYGPQDSVIFYFHLKPTKKVSKGWAKAMGLIMSLSLCVSLSFCCLSFESESCSVALAGLKLTSNSDEPWTCSDWGCRWYLPCPAENVFCLCN